MERKKITCQKPAAAMPEWAYLERSLIQLMNQSIDIVLEKYLRPDGELLWPPVEDFVSYDGLDDAYESFHSWPLFYLLGGDKRFLELSHRQFEIITKQFTRYDCGSGHPMVVKEYEQGYDWMHQGEGYLFFYFLNLADPKNEKNRERSIRYAGFYLNEDDTMPEKNYDPEHKLLKCAYLGSMGPGYHNFNGDWNYAPYMDYYGLPFYDVPGVVTLLDLKDPAKAKAMGDVRRARLQKSDTVTNLISTSMVMNAYLHTGDEKYKNWILEYSGAWRERCRENGGIIPDNCGPAGRVGELMDGKWYGGHYGWTFPHGFHFIADALTIAGENECLLTRDPDKVLWVREQTEKLLEHAVEVDGTILVPQKYTDDGAILEYSIVHDNIITQPDRVTERPDFSRKRQIDGWYEFEPLNPTEMTHVSLTAFDDKAREIIAKTRNNKTRTWECLSKSYSKYMGGQDHAYMNFLDGGYPEYPVDVLMHSMAQVYGRLKMMREDTQDPATYSDAYLQQRNPITTEALVQLTMGGPFPVYNGGLLMVSIRYFDAEEGRAGLPEDVAALVSKVERDSIELALCNIHPINSRTLIIQAGAFGEHTFTAVQYTRDDGSTSEFEVNDSCFEIEIGPGSILDLRIGMDRFANQPSYQIPV
jgi:hypothetical protein